MNQFFVRDPFHMMRRLMTSAMEDSDGFDELTLPVDISEEDDALMVRASVPGVRREDIDVQVNQGVLSITARPQQEFEARSDRYYRQERRIGVMSRRITLPGIVQDANVKATLEHGVLTLTIPVPEQRRPKRIEIEESSNSRGQQQIPMGQDAARQTSDQRGSEQQAAQQQESSQPM